jgi:mono/diheme cytochrome c family protein
MLKFSAATLALLVAGPSLAQAPPPGEALYQAHCAMCHDNGVEDAPTKAAMAARTAAEIEATLKTGAMSAMAKDLDAAQIATIAAYLGKAPSAAGAAPKAPSAGGR